MITNPLDRGWIVGIETNGHSRRERITTESLLSDEVDEVKSAQSGIIKWLLLLNDRY